METKRSSSPGSQMISALKAEIDLYRSFGSLEAFDALGDGDLERFLPFLEGWRDALRDALRLFLSKTEEGKIDALETLEKKVDGFHGLEGSIGAAAVAPVETVKGLCVQGTVQIVEWRLSLMTVLHAAQVSNLYYPGPRTDGEKSWEGSLSRRGHLFAFRFYAATRSDAKAFQSELKSFVSREEWSKRVELPAVNELSHVTFAPSLHEMVEPSHCMRWIEFGGWAPRYFFNSTADFAAFAVALKGAKVLERLVFSGWGVGSHQAAALAEGLGANKSVTEVNLSHCSLNSDGAVSLARALRDNESIKTLDISGNVLRSEGGVALAEALEVNKTMTSINLCASEIGAEGGVALADALKSNKTMTSINLGRNEIGLEGVVALAEALKDNKSLTSISLSGNEIGAEGGIALAEALKVNESLSSINLFLNEIGTESAVALAEALKNNKSLSSIELSYNGIGTEGAVALAETLKVNKMLSRIHLSGNRIGTEGVVALAEALKVNRTLVEVTLSLGHDDEAAAAALTDAIKVNNTLQRFRFLNSNEPTAVSQCIAAAVDANPVVLVHLTPEQRLAFLMGLVRRPRQGEHGSLIRGLPLDVVKRILLGYKVAQGRRRIVCGTYFITK